MTEEEELQAVIDKILSSKSQRKIIVSGPGTGKTSLFKRLLKANDGDPNNIIVLTFINSLRDDLEKNLSKYSRVNTLHSYCLGLLHKNPDLRYQLTEPFICFPGLSSLICDDWEILNKSDSPQFIKEMRKLEPENHIEFYITRGNYYHAVDFDDTVYRIVNSIQSGRAESETFELILVDEFQDFNCMEAFIIEDLAHRNKIVIAGDDDQALYSQLRDANWDYIRRLCSRAEYEVFELPYCMRCTRVIVDAISDIIEQAKRLRKLEGRIDKPYKYFPRVKEADSILYPEIDLIVTSVQKSKLNYMGRYIEEILHTIPQKEVDQAIEDNYPAALIIASDPYRGQITEYLLEKGINLDVKAESENKLSKIGGITLLKENIYSNLGWRIILNYLPSDIRNTVIENTRDCSKNIIDLLPSEIRDEIIREVENTTEVVRPEEAKVITKGSIPVKITSFEGAKGLSAQHVYIAGIHNGELPIDVSNINDIEICKLIVGLSRTRKKCSFLITRNFAGHWKQPSIFIDWIDRERFRRIDINKYHWK